NVPGSSGHIAGATLAHAVRFRQCGRAACPQVGGGGGVVHSRVLSTCPSLADDGTAASTVPMPWIPLAVRVAVAALASVAVALGAAAAPAQPSPASPAFPDFPAFPAPAPPSPVFRLLAASAITGIPHSPPVPGDVIRPY